jgi:opacity protein-like surface antigen
MKKSVVIACMMALLFAGNAFAAPVQFTVNGISFDSLVGNDEQFTWSVTPVAGPIAFSLNVGESLTFKYGAFSTTDFSLDSTDRNDNNDSFRANFDVQPPSPPWDGSRTGSPDATLQWSWDEWENIGAVIVDFNNDAIGVNFGTGGHYHVEFLDPATLYGNGSIDLRAKITLKSDSTAVPEPMSLLLLGLGLLGIGAVRRKN